MKKTILLALLLSLPATAQSFRPRDYPSGVKYLSTANGTCEDGVTSEVVETGNSGTVGIDVSGTWTGTLLFKTKIGQGGGYQAVSATPLGGGTAVTSTTGTGGGTGNGQWTVSVAGSMTVCVAFSSAAVTGTAVVQLNSSPSTSTSGAVSSVATPYSTAGTAFQTSMSSTTQVVGLSGSGLKYYITGFWCSANAAVTCGLTSSTTAGNSCSGGATVIAPVYIPANGGASPAIGSQPIAVTANSALCCTPSAGTAECQVNYYVAP